MDGKLMNNLLPEAFLNRMKNQLGDGLDSFIHAMEEPAVRGIRFNAEAVCRKQPLDER